VLLHIFFDVLVLRLVNKDMIFFSLKDRPEAGDENIISNFEQYKKIANHFFWVDGCDLSRVTMRRPSK